VTEVLSAAVAQGVEKSCRHDAEVVDDDLSRRCVEERLRSNDGAVPCLKECLVLTISSHLKRR